ncbi:hypothetical protein NEF87_003809 [Candidatus Lokiarchaeum ossiferum]|uniref:HTH arsR-type domain-containing protein n=1 Tax=Candidatus Lokiarchaeum ossiferum TaxID=2951803 RepID=A0ABY6HYA0_9ARCH|nr:hypothetical protein NEF87_003809 [Candidatus Lokiarchaeum sp. B-35]
MTQEKKEASVKDIFKNNLRFQMWGLFSMYPELTLADLSEKLGKSKSTIHPHLKILEELGIIEEIREEKVRGNIKAKVYQLQHDYEEKLTSWEKKCDCHERKEVDKAMGKTLIENTISRVKIMKKTLETEMRFLEKLQNSGIDGPDEYALQILNDIYSFDPERRSRTYSLFDYMSHDSYMEYMKFYDKFFKEINIFERAEMKANPKAEKPYHAFTHIIPLKTMLEYLYPKKKK